ncbi:NAD(P)/FAD-dependent oxidoreductase [Streptomyces sp. ZYX-F-203]
MTGDHRPDVVVVGAGPAGLACALDLGRAGRRVLLVEAADRVGGRMRTDRRDGFLLDRGFQVFNTGYPQVAARLDVRRLRLGLFTPGFVVRAGTGEVRIADPLRGPGWVGSLVRGRTPPLRDLAALAGITTRDALLSPGVIKRRPDTTTAVALARAGLSVATVDRILRPFLSGVFLEDRLETSARFFHLVWRSMARGSLGLPAEGIGAVPERLARGLPPGTLLLGAPVREITDVGVLLTDGRELPAPRVVVATDAVTAARLLPGLAIPDGRTVTTYYHAAERTPSREPTLLVDADGPLLNTCVLSEVAPTYAPPGTALVSSSVLGPDRPGLARIVRARLAELHGTDTDGWRQLASYTVENALPVMRPPWPPSRTTRFAPGRYVCGDHRATGSVQGALASGARAAREVLADRVVR